MALGPLKFLNATEMVDPENRNHLAVCSIMSSSCKVLAGSIVSHSSGPKGGFKGGESCGPACWQ